MVEDQDLDRLGVAQQFPVYKQQLCVILPRAAHVNRINNILRNRNPTRYSATANSRLSARAFERDQLWASAPAGEPNDLG